MAKKTVYVTNLTRNVTAEHVREIFGAHTGESPSQPVARVLKCTASACFHRDAGFYGTIVSVELPLDAHVRGVRPGGSLHRVGF